MSRIFWLPSLCGACCVPNRYATIHSHVDSTPPRRGETERRYYLHTSDVQWIENTLRSHWAFTGTPLRIVFRTRETRGRRKDQASKEYGRRRNMRTRDVKRKLESLGGGVAFASGSSLD